MKTSPSPFGWGSNVWLHVNIPYDNFLIQRYLHVYKVYGFLVYEILDYFLGLTIKARYKYIFTEDTDVFIVQTKSSGILDLTFSCEYRYILQKRMQS